MSKNITLSEGKQAILATLYLFGVRKVNLIHGKSINISDFDDYNSTLVQMIKPYFSKTSIFNFSELSVLKDDNYFVELELEDLIVRYCNKFRHVLETNSKTFDVSRIKNTNTFLIVQKDPILENTLIQFPTIVYGFLHVNGTNFETSTVTYENIANELLVYEDELESLMELAKKQFWEIN